MRTLRSLADLEELRKLLPDGPDDVSVTVAPTQEKPVQPPATLRPAAPRQGTPPRPSASALRAQYHTKPVVTPQQEEPTWSRKANAKSLGIGGGKLLVTSKGKGDFTFEKTRQATLEVLERIYGRADLWREDGGELHLYVPSEDIGSWIGSRGVVAGNLKAIFGVERVRVHDIAELAA